MAIYLHEKYADEIQSKFTKESLIAGRLSDHYNFTGAKTVNVTTPITVPMVDYTRTGANRYGTPQEMQDIVQEMTLSQDKSFSLTIDKGNNEDQSGVKAAGKMLALQIAEQAVPTMDKYCFDMLAHRAGKICRDVMPLDRDNICSRISAGTIYMDDKEVPSEDRTLYVTSAGYAMLRFSDEFQKCEPLMEKSLSKGQVGTYDGMAVIKVPPARWPNGVNFIIVHKSAACAPVKLNDTKLHQDPPGISGALLEGRQYYDLFVLAAKCDGVYVDVNNEIAECCETPEFDGCMFTCETEGARVIYTTDGSDPRYSATAIDKGYFDAEDVNKPIKFYAYKSGAFPSDVEEG